MVSFLYNVVMLLCDCPLTLAQPMLLSFCPALKIVMYATLVMQKFTVESAAT